MARFRLGEWRVEPEVNRLVGAHRQRLLEPRHMAVLLALMQAPDRTLTKAQLLDTVWPHRFVVDGVLKRAISQLRRALGDDARAPRYIETLYKVGYRLVTKPMTCGGDTVRRFPSTPYNMVDVSRCMAREALCASARTTFWPGG
ncbi:MAG: transcriptional regulator [Gammaproteobacteria bacterium]